MKKSIYKFSLICGMLLTLAAFPVFAQNVESELNKKPLQDFGQNVYEKVEKREVDLKSPFSLTMQGTFDADGKFDKKTVKIKKSEGDAKMIEVAKQGIEAISNSGILYYLKQLGVNEIEIAVAQTGTEFSANFKSTFKTEDQAKTVTSGMNMFLQVGKHQVKDDVVKKALLESSGVETVGKDFLLKFSMPFEQFHGMINKELEKVKQ